MRDDSEKDWTAWIPAAIVLTILLALAWQVPRYGAVVLAGLGVVLWSIFATVMFLAPSTRWAMVHVMTCCALAMGLGTVITVLRPLDTDVNELCVLVGLTGTVTSITFPLLTWQRRLERQKRCPLSICHHCGYNLTGNVSGICPECGVMTRQRDMVERSAQKRRAIEALESGNLVDDAADETEQ